MEKWKYWFKYNENTMLRANDIDVMFIELINCNINVDCAL